MLVPDKRRPIKAIEEQIDTWNFRAHEALDSRHQAMQQQMEKRHELERTKSQTKDTRTRHAQEQDTLKKKISDEIERLNQSVEAARQTGIIPDKNYAPIHTIDEITRWSKEMEERLAAELRRKDPGPRPGDTGWHDSMMFDPTNEGEWAALYDLDQEAFYTGRIPDEDYCRENGLPLPDKDQERDKDHGQER